MTLPQKSLWSRRSEGSKTGRVPRYGESAGILGPNSGGTAELIRPEAFRPQGVFCRGGPGALPGTSAQSCHLVCKGGL